MERVLIKETPRFIGKKVKVSGWVNSFRDHGKVFFVNLRDRSGLLQIVFWGNIYKKAKELRPEWVVSIEGEISKRPQGTENKEMETGEIEMRAEKLEILSRAEELPIDLTKKELELKLNTLLDNRPLTIRHQKTQAIFRVAKTILDAYRKIMKDLDFFEIKTPKIIGAASEGGANFFTLDYFGKKAFLAQSPQFYKQICIGAFERVFEIGPVFRKEPHFTTRHLNEYISMDAEMGFISGIEDIMAELEKVINYIFQKIKEESKRELQIFGINDLKIPKKIPRLKLKEAKEKIKNKYKYEVPEDTDIDPKGEKLIGRLAKEEYNSDFIFLTHYPKKDRPFYTMPSKNNSQETESFDLIFLGTEIVTGSQRIHDFKMLIENIKKWKLDPKDFDFYLQAFKYGLPPHGGWGMGLERLVYKVLNLSTIKKVSLFPRDVKRLVP
jgi:nondiscriminating aspartyl-tRNA synthetase